MKNHRKLFTLFSALLLAFAALSGTALAAETGSAEPAQGAQPASILYPAEVRTSEENGVVRLEKVYYLSTRDDPAAIPTEDFDREGRHYTLLDVLKNDQSETDTRDYIEVITLESETKDIGEIIQTLEPEREVITEEGYTGILKPDYTNITVEAAGYQTSSWMASATRIYPNLSDADVSLIPKTITDNGRTLTLADVDWQEAGGFYNAEASYTAIVSGRSVTGYTVTVEYGGEISRTSCDTIIYTAVFSSENASHGETHFEPEPVEEPASDNGDGGSNDSSSNSSSNANSADNADNTDNADSAVNAGNGSISDELIARKIVITALVGIAALAIVGYVGWKIIKFIRDKKRGYV